MVSLCPPRVHVLEILVPDVVTGEMGGMCKGGDNLEVIRPWECCPGKGLMP